MNTNIKNSVRLIGNIGQAPEIRTFDNNKKTETKLISSLFDKSIEIIVKQKYINIIAHTVNFIYFNLIKIIKIGIN